MNFALVRGNDPRAIELRAKTALLSSVTVIEIIVSQAKKGEFLNGFITGSCHSLFMKIMHLGTLLTDKAHIAHTSSWQRACRVAQSPNISDFLQKIANRSKGE